MSRTRVGIIGAGIAGPVLAIFLKNKGYEPVVFERNDPSAETGLGIGIQVNGQRVLMKIPGLVEAIGGETRDEWRAYSTVEGDKGLLGVSDFPTKQKESTGLVAVSVGRGELQRAVVNFAQDAGIEFKWRHRLVALEQTDEDVTVTFDNGVKETFSFVVGCDGLHSKTRAHLFGEQPADYTGIAQWGGLSPIPEFFREKNFSADIYGDGVSMITIRIPGELMLWAITMKEPEARESWRAIDEAAMNDFKENSPYSKWEFGAGELIRTSKKITKYGLYDRPELKCWHQGRIVLLGDAAHPTSPHVGQGANQAFEDIDVLTTLLEKYNPDAGSPPTTTLETIFTEYEQARIPRSSAMVKQARSLGETRVASGTEACIARNNWCRKVYSENRLHERFPV